jgi:L-threonylcarbamoyladenylate synthase
MAARILPPSAENIALAVAALRAGGIVAMPTETVYGLAGVAFDERALSRIFAVKERPTFDPLICHVPVAQDDWLEHLAQQGLVEVSALSTAAQQHTRALAKTFWPGPLTLVLPKQPRVPDLSTSGLPTVGVRSPRHPAAQALLREVGQPLAAPSANRFGRISPTEAAHVVAELGDRIEFILDGGPCEIGIESTVLLIEPDGRLLLLRPGEISREAIAAATGAHVETRGEAIKSQSPLPSPGLLASHYAPQKPLRLVDRSQLAAACGRIGVLALDHIPALSGNFAGVSLTLSRCGDVHEIARRLFGALRQLDESQQVDEIWSHLLPDQTGLAFAINDRLTKASHRG